MSNGQALEALRTDGYVILRDVLPDSVLEQVRNALLPLLDCQAWGKGEFFGNRTRRVHNILAKTRAVDPLVAHPAVLELLDLPQQTPLRRKLLLEMLEQLLMHINPSLQLQDPL